MAHPAELRKQLTAFALSLPGAAPSGYGLGRAGRVNGPFGGHSPALATLAWVEAGYGAIAPKRRVAELDRRGM